MTWNAPKVIGGEGLTDFNVSGELWEQFSIGLSSVIYEVHDTNGVVVTNCSFDIEVIGELILQQLKLFELFVKDDGFHIGDPVTISVTNPDEHLQESVFCVCFDL